MGPLEWDSEDEMEPLVHHMHRMVYCNQTLYKVESRIAQWLSVVTVLQAGRSRGHVFFSPDRLEVVLGPTQPPVRWVPRLYPGHKVPEE
jgi:hypothetical protein